MGVTAHFITDSWELESLELDFVELQSHTGKQIAKQFTACLKKFGLESKISGITVDNASNNNTFICSLESSTTEWEGNCDCEGSYCNVCFSGELTTVIPIELHFHCFAHVLNLAVQESLKTISGALENLRGIILKIRNSINLRQKFSECSKLCLIADCKTRWNSTYSMVKRALDLKKELIDFLEENDDVGKIKEDEWKSFRYIAKYLEVFFEYTNSASGDKYPTLSDTFPKYNHLMNYLEELQEKVEHKFSHSIVSEAADLALKKIQFYYNKTNNAYYIATILDPRFKLGYFEDEKDKDSVKSADVKKIFVSVYETYLANSKGEKEPEPKKLKKISAHFQFPISTTSTRKGEYLEVQQYLVEPQIPGDNCILKYWKENEKKFPTLAKIAKDYLCIPTTSAPVERLFSKSGRILSWDRSRMTATTARERLTTAAWEKFFLKHTPKSGKSEILIQ